MILTAEIGAKIKYYRKKRGLKIAELAELLHKTGATVSKYESGQIAIDVVTLYEIAAALGVPPEKLLYYAPMPAEELEADSVPAFFRGVERLYMYYFDGRNGSLVRSVIDIRAKTGPHTYDVALYMNFQDYRQYQNCENTYLGTLSHYDALSNIVTHNRDTEMDIYLVCVPASYLNAETKWGQGFGISCRPIMPTSTKVFLSKTIQAETPEFLQDLRVSKEDIQLLKRYNMLSVM